MAIEDELGDASVGTSHTTTHTGVEADLMIKRAYVKVSTPILNGAQRGDGRSGRSTIPP